MGILSLQPVFRQAKQPQKKQFLPYTSELQTPPDLTRWYKARIDDKQDVKGVAKKLSASPYLQAAEPDYLRKLAPEGPVRILTNDPKFNEQWQLTAIKASEAWSFLASQGINPGGSNAVVVAVIDTGVDYNHPDLALNMWTNPAELTGQPGVDNDGNGFIDDIYGANVVGTHSGNPMDDHGHGTHVAGIIAAQANNNIGGVGVANNVKIMAIKAAQYSGVLSTTDMAEALIYAMNKGADVINMSFGGYAKSQVEEDALVIAFGQAVLVAAAGNDGKVNLPCPLGINFYPAAYNWILGVMASNQAGSRAGFSNFDCTPRDIQEYEVLAPGVDILSTFPNNQYVAWDGTSMAAPIVSGIAALLRSHPLFSNKDVYSSRFIMGQIAANGADAYKALTVYPKPELSYLQHWLFDTAAQSPGNDADGIVDAGETIDLAIVIRNHWGKADNVEVNLKARAIGTDLDDPYVTFATSTVNYGAIGSFNWDDNGLIYNSQGVITGVSNPFSFTVSSAAYNDHVIPFILTMTAKNGLAPADTATYTFQSRFNLMVQRGKEIPSIISQSITLNKDYFWIIPGSTLIAAGSTVTITAGTQVQFGTPTPRGPYSDPTTPRIQVEGLLYIQGTYGEPVELFPSSILGGKTQIINKSITNLKYTKIRNPILGFQWSEDQEGIMSGGPITSIDHSYIDSDNFYPYYKISSNNFNNSILYKINKIHTPARGIELGNTDKSLVISNIINLEVYTYSSYAWPIIPKNSTIIAPDSGYLWILSNSFSGTYASNACLNRYSDPNINHWTRFKPRSYGASWPIYIINNPILCMKIHICFLSALIQIAHA